MQPKIEEKKQNNQMQLYKHECLLTYSNHTVSGKAEGKSHQENFWNKPTLSRGSSFPFELGGIFLVFFLFFNTQAVILLLYI